MLAVCAGLAALGARAAVAAGPDDWWDSQWQYRLTVEVVEAARRGGINTALLNLAEQGQLCRPDGRDVRVMALGGRPVPHCVRVRDNKTLDVLFRVPDDSDRFRIYYGNPLAEKAEGQWDESLGGLLLETRPVDRPVNSPNEIPGAVRRYTRTFGSKPWEQIWDLQNPFGRNDLYMSIYKGTLYCPETGQYLFAINADDVAFFSIEELADPMCWRGPGVPSMGWHDPQNPRATREVSAQKGVYHVRYYHVENYGSQLAKLGWRTPSSDTIITVPKEAFVRYLPAEILAREEQGRILSPFFVARHRYNLRVNGLEPGFPAYRFETRMSPESRAAGLQYLWDFGDGSTASGPVVEHMFSGAESRQVTLTVRDADGGEARLARPVTPPVGSAREARLRLHVHADSQLMGSGAPLRLHVLALGQGAAEQPFELVTSAVRGRGPGREERTRSFPLLLAAGSPDVQGERAEVQETYPSTRGNLRITVRALLRGVEVALEKMAVLRTDGPLTGLHLDRAQNLRDQENSLVVLRLAAAHRSEATPRRICEPKTGAVTIVAFDEMLGGPPGRSGQTNYGEALRGLLAARYPELAFTFRRSGPEGGAECSPLERFLHLSRSMGRSRINVALLVCQPQSVINGVPVGEFEKCLSASVDQVLKCSRAEVIVLTPPPVPGSPEAARPYARAAKRVGLRKGVPVVDLYSRFLLMEDWEGLFQPGTGRYPSFRLYPNERGQERIAREVYAAFIENFHRDVSAGMRKVMLMRAARPASAGR